MADVSVEQFFVFIFAPFTDNRAQVNTARLEISSQAFTVNIHVVW